MSTNQIIIILRIPIMVTERILTEFAIRFEVLECFYVDMKSKL